MAYQPHNLASIKEGGVCYGGDGGLKEGEAAVNAKEGLSVERHEGHTTPHRQDISIPHLY